MACFGESQSDSTFAMASGASVVQEHWDEARICGVRLAGWIARSTAMPPQTSTLWMRGGR